MSAFAAGAVFYRGAERWSLWMDNPNKAAALLAMVALVLFAAALRARRRWAVWCCSALAGAACCALVCTFSRGGLLALVAGAAVLFAGARRELPAFRRWIPLLLAAAMAVGAAAWTGFAGRVARSAPSVDASAGNRIELWKAAPRMMADAPGGWGLGRSGAAYMGWYQPLDRCERYRSLVNSHLTWLVEFGWPGRWLLVAGWLFVLGMGFVRLKTRGDPLPLAVWTSFAVAAFFSSVAEEWILWAIPVATGLASFRVFDPSLALPIRVAVAGATALTAALFIVGSWQGAGETPVRRSFGGGRLVFGGRAPESWIVFDGVTMGGETYGRALRAFIGSPEGAGRMLGVAASLSDVPTGVRRLAICGRTADANALPGLLAAFPRLEELRVLSPSDPAAWVRSGRGGRVKVRVFCGDLAPNCPVEDGGSGAVVVPGAGEYLPNWPELVAGR